MSEYFPFKVIFKNGALYGSPEQMYEINADFLSPEFSAYKALVDRYGALKGELSLVDVTALIIEDAAPSLLDHMDFDEESYQIDMHADSEAALEHFISIVCPVYQNLEILESFIHRVSGRH
jgi:hypothetical protein